jgi:hypothetical protein
MERCSVLVLLCSRKTMAIAVDVLTRYKPTIIKAHSSLYDSSSSLLSSLSLLYATRPLSAGAGAGAEAGAGARAGVGTVAGAGEGAEVSNFASSLCCFFLGLEAGLFVEDLSDPFLFWDKEET